MALKDKDGHTVATVGAPERTPEISARSHDAVQWEMGVDLAHGDGLQYARACSIQLLDG
jgi:hypothetical protein